MWFVEGKTEPRVSFMTGADQQDLVHGQPERAALHRTDVCFREDGEEPASSASNYFATVSDFRESAFPREMLTRKKTQLCPI